MSKLRSVNTHFWNDNYIIDLDPIEKLLFLYLLTNPNTNMLGIYELHVRKISFDTGIDKEMVLKIFDRFHKSGKASYVKGYVCLHNFTKHQAYNDNMKKSAISSFNELPEVVKKQEFIKELLKALKPLPKGSEPIAEYEVEVERELEVENEEEVDTPVDQLSDTKVQAKEVSEYLLDSIIHYDPSHRYASNTPSINSWIKDIDRAIRLDGREVEQLKFIIEYIYRYNGRHSDFWAGNIESGKKLRKHFDKIKTQIKSERNGTRTQPTKGDRHVEAIRDL